jgi:sulfatase maturation enzyme AslB (radical SAM superfamily)
METEYVSNYYVFFISIDSNFIKMNMEKPEVVAAAKAIEIAISIDGVQKDFSLNSFKEKLGFKK